MDEIIDQSSEEEIDDNKNPRLLIDQIEFINLLYNNCSISSIMKLRQLSKLWLIIYRKQDVMRLIENSKNTINNDKKRLGFYLAFYSYLPPQKSKKWKL